MPVILGGNTGIYLASLAPSVDPDAQAFITAASITDPTQQSAINQLVVDLKGYGLWTKIYAAYPMVGGTSTSTSYNLKNTAQYQITWNGGWTFNQNGVTPNGVNGFGNTGFNPVTVGITKTNFGVSAYSRTNIVEVGSLIGLMDATGLSRVEIRPRSNSTTDVLSLYDDSFGASNYLTNSLGLFTAVRTGTTQKYYQGATEKSQRTGFAATADINENIYLGARNWVTQAPDSYSTKQTAWAAFHEFFDATQMNNYNTAVQTFQVSLGRSIGTQTVSDADAQAFVTNAGIVDQVEANAVNNLVIGLKADGLWTKMKAVYPFVGGSSTSNSYNLKNTAQYQITWYGGVTHSSNGITGNGTNAYGDTFLANNVMAQNDAHISVYSRTNWQQVSVDIGSWNGSFGSFIYSRSAANTFETTINSTNRIIQANLDSRGFYLVTRKSGTSQTGQKNTTQYVTATASTNHITTSFKLLRPGEYNGEYSPRNLAFASIGDGLTDAEALNLNSRVTTFQTALNRNV